MIHLLVLLLHIVVVGIELQYDDSLLQVLDTSVDKSIVNVAGILSMDDPLDHLTFSLSKLLDDLPLTSWQLDTLSNSTQHHNTLHMPSVSLLNFHIHGRYTSVMIDKALFALHVERQLPRCILIHRAFGKRKDNLVR